MSAAANADRRTVLWLAAGVVLLVVLTAIFAPVTRDDDPAPTTYNSGTHGAKAAFLLLGALGYDVSRSDQTLTSALDGADAPHTSLILAGPNAPSEEAQRREYAAVERFLRRGGRVLATGFRGAYFLPSGRTGDATQFLNGLCNTVPEGLSAYAQTGPVAIYDQTSWSSPDPAVRVDQRCGGDAVVVHKPYAHGGEFVWWSNSEPLTTRGLAQDSSLRLLLAAIGPPRGPGARRVLFDEFYHGEQASAADYLRGLPMRSLLLQALLVAGLLVFSYSRRSGPLRTPVRIPRTSPVEFAENMGALYQRAGATQPATEAARRRLFSFLHTVCGLPQETLRGSSDEIATSLHVRFGVDAEPVTELLERASAARYEKLRPREALLLVRNLDEQMDKLRERIQPDQTKSSSTTNQHAADVRMETTT
jgi:hypothetical protein